MKMELRICQILLWLIFVYPSICKTPGPQADLDGANSIMNNEDTNVHNYKDDKSYQCLDVNPPARDIGKRFCAILPYFDRKHANTEFLHKFRGTVNQMGEGDDMLDREVAYYAAALTPLMFLQRYRDTWCLLERFHRALRLYQISHPTEKRKTLKILQNFRAVNQKIRQLLETLPRPQPLVKSFTKRYVSDEDDTEASNKKDFQILKQLVKNLE